MKGEVDEDLLPVVDPGQSLGQDHEAERGCGGLGPEDVAAAADMTKGDEDHLLIKGRETSLCFCLFSARSMSELDFSITTKLFVTRGMQYSIT